MKIKPFILSFVFVSISIVAVAQKGELNSAKANYDKFFNLKQANSAVLGMLALKDAKTSIDKAVVNEKTSSDPSAWTYKALIYGNLAIADTIPATSKPLISEATSALAKAKKLDNAGTNKASLDQANVLLGDYEFTQGVAAYKSNRFAEAYNAFNNVANYHTGDTIAVYYAGLSAINAKDHKGAIQQYSSLIKTNFSNNNQIYLDLSRLYGLEKDTTSALRVAAEGSKKFPEQTSLAIQEIELSLLTGKQKEVISKITDQAQKEPKNKLYPFYLGIAYNSINDTQKAQEAYKKAIEVDPNYADAYINLGSLILNNGIDLYNTANKLPQSKQREYDEMIKQATLSFDLSFPYLQKAYELSPNSRAALESLKTYYILKKNKEKIDEITQKLRNLK